MTTKYEDLSNEALDRLIAERVCGMRLVLTEREILSCRIIPEGKPALYKWQPAPWQKYEYCTEDETPPKFTTSFDTCLEHLIPAMQKRGFYIERGIDLVGVIWSIKFQDATNFYPGYKYDSLPRATCIAALLALDELNKQKLKEKQNEI